MKKVAFIALAIACMSIASCANTVRGVAQDTKQTGLAFQDGTTSVLKAGATKKHSSQ